jgi:hypothetical protein
VCHDNTFHDNRVWIQIFATVGNTNCSNVCGVTNACCPFQARIGNLRLKRGVVRSIP